MNEQRPDSGESLVHKIQGTKGQRGKLKIFLGPVAGVGKTYAMLEAAQDRKAEGIDVVVGYVESHDRTETEALLTGLETLPLRHIEHRGVELQEFDLEAALARCPTLLLIDELAHTNATGSRHQKRWQDVEELRDAGINVYTTVNIQHVESLNDVIAQITGIIVRETIPDSILEQADEVELIDLAPDDLIQRLKEGKVHVPQQAEQSIRSFFRKGNLMALRELALRKTADRVDDQMQDYRRDHVIGQTWPAGERVLVAVSPNPLAGRLVRAAKRMAMGLHADWLAVYVEMPNTLHMPEADRNRVTETLRLAERLGAETATLSGHSVSEAILTFARDHNVSKIIVGKPVHSRLRDLWFGSILEDLVRNSGTIDVYVISGDVQGSRAVTIPRVLRRTSHWRAYMQAMLVVAVCTALSSIVFPYFAPATLIMIYLVGVVLSAARYGRGPSILASIVSVAAFDFLFVPPHLTFAVADTQYMITFAVMLLVAITISSLMVRIKHQAESARDRELRTASLYRMSREFANSNGTDELVEIAARHMGETLDSQVIILFPDRAKKLTSHNLSRTSIEFSAQEEAVANWVYDHAQPAGVATETLRGAKGLYLPLSTSRGVVGVVGVYPSQPDRFFSPDQRHLLETFTNQTALAIERARLAQETEAVRVEMESERLRNSLLSSVSHDLRTPLAAITGAVSSLLQNDSTLDQQDRIELATVAYEEADRLNRLVGNLLEMTRLESGGVTVEKEWQPLEEVVGSALMRLRSKLEPYPLRTHLPPDLPLIPLDSVLIEQVLVNLLENAVKYTPPGTSIELSAWASEEEITVEVADRGPGLPLGEEQRVFEKFYRSHPTTASGVGLGLTISRGIIEAHGGRIWAENRSGGGASFRFTLPLEGEPPMLGAE